MIININLSTDDLSDYRILIYSLNGDIVRKIEDLQEKMSLQFNNQGTYILQLQSKEGIIKETTKFIINH